MSRNSKFLNGKQRTRVEEICWVRMEVGIAVEILACSSTDVQNIEDVNRRSV